MSDDDMASIRATIVLDEAIAARVRQLFGGNLSKGINVLLHEHLNEEKKESAFGILKGKVSSKDVLEMEEEDERLGREHEKLHR
ncbi:MAG TPA: hypothetical protein VJI71_02990 [Candidatus Norongarragalinales archaeon]|nr:hypothetical protein [Candidatus Norongarragalinales archaeon]